MNYLVLAIVIASGTILLGAYGVGWWQCFNLFHRHRLDVDIQNPNKGDLMNDEDLGPLDRSRGGSLMVIAILTALNEWSKTDAGISPLTLSFSPVEMAEIMAVMSGWLYALVCREADMAGLTFEDVIQDLAVYITTDEHYHDT